MSQLLERVQNRPRLPSPATQRALFVAAGVSHDDVAAEMGVHRVTVTRWVSGKRSPRGDLARRYAELLDGLRQVIE